MRKFQQWQDNQVYFIHLNNLANIKARRLPNYKESKHKIRSLSQSKENIQSIHTSSNKIFVRSIKTSFKPKRIKDKGILDEKKLIRENLLLGKRIMEAPSILSTTFRSKTKQRAFDYLRNSKEHRFETQRSSRFQHFKNLQQSYKYIEGTGSNVLRIKIKQLEYQAFRIKNVDEYNLSLVVQVGKTVRCSQMVSVQTFLNHEFNLRFKRKIFNTDINLKIRCHIGNSDIQIGQFFMKPMSEQQGQQSKTDLLKHTGNRTGSVNYVYWVIKAINDFDKL